MIKIRKATINDLSTVQNLNKLLFEYDTLFNDTLCIGGLFGRGKSYFSKLIKNDFVWIAENNNAAIGYLAGSYKNKKYYSNEEYAELENMYVIEEFRKHGVGKLLFEEFDKQCKQRGVKAIRVTASAKNIGAVAFYKKNGFEEFDIILRKDIKE